MKKIKEKIIRITPCCKTRHWHSVTRIDVPGDIVRCELCDKLLDFEALEIIQKGLNPLTFFCDKCHKSALEEYYERKSPRNNHPRVGRKII